MTTFSLYTDVNAPPQRCFDLARSMDFHTHSMGLLGTRERIVGGRTSGLIGLNEEVEFEARHLGLTRRLRARITSFDPPRTFSDEQTPGGGSFRALRHTHTFEPLTPTSTRVTDSLTIDIGLGLFGRLVEGLIVRPHLTRLIAAHQRNLKRAAESEGWKRFLK